MNDSLAPDVVAPLLQGRFGRVYRYAELSPSTQRLLEEGDAEGTIAVAEEQLPVETQMSPTSLRLELGEAVDRAQLLVAILAQLEHAYDAWIRGAATGTSGQG